MITIHTCNRRTASASPHWFRTNPSNSTTASSRAMSPIARRSGTSSRRARETRRAFALRLAGVHEAFGYPLIGALIGEPKLLVLDRPQIVYARRFSTSSKVARCSRRTRMPPRREPSRNGARTCRLRARGSTRSGASSSIPCAAAFVAARPTGRFCGAALSLLAARHRDGTDAKPRTPSVPRPVRTECAALRTPARARKSLRSLHRGDAGGPCVCASDWLRGAADAPFTFLITIAAVIAATLTALCATIRRGASRALYVALAAAASGIAYGLAVTMRSVPAELVFCAIVALVALRQYGEALARYDPI